MNTEQMAEQALKEILERTLNGVDAAAQFSKEQIPDVVEQLLLWHSIDSFLFFIIGLAISIVVPITAQGLTRTLQLNISKDEAKAAYERGESWTRFSRDSVVTSSAYDEIMSGTAVFNRCFIMFIASIPMIAGLILMFENLEWLQIIVAPKLYLLEYAAELVK